MIVRILIILILLLSVLNIVGRPANNQAAAPLNKATNAQKASPESVTPLIEILSALTILLLSRGYLNRRLNKIKAAALKAKINKRLLLPVFETSAPIFSNALQ